MGLKLIPCIENFGLSKSELYKYNTTPENENVVVYYLPVQITDFLNFFSSCSSSSARGRLRLFSILLQSYLPAQNFKTRVLNYTCYRTKIVFQTDSNYGCSQIEVCLHISTSNPVASQSPRLGV